MPTAVFVGDGRMVDVVPDADVAAGDVLVIGDLVGVARKPIEAGKSGAVEVEGIFDFPKLAELIVVGAKVFWSEASLAVTLVATGNKPLGKCVRRAGVGEARVWVRLSPGLDVTAAASSSSGSSSGSSSAGSSAAMSSSWDQSSSGAGSGSWWTPSGSSSDPSMSSSSF